VIKNVLDDVWYQPRFRSLLQEQDLVQKELT
jgi:hypothetical protein